jgi:hypothetical protein
MKRLTYVERMVINEDTKKEGVRSMRGMEEEWEGRNLEDEEEEEKCGKDGTRRSTNK